MEGKKIQQLLDELGDTRIVPTGKQPEDEGWPTWLGNLTKSIEELTTAVNKATAVAENITYRMWGGGRG